MIYTMNESPNKTRSDSSSTISEPLPDGYQRYIVIRKKPPTSKTNLAQRQIHDGTDVEELLGTIEDLHKEVCDALEAADRVRVECSKCCVGISFSNCFRLRAKVDVDAKGNKASVV